MSNRRTGGAGRVFLSFLACVLVLPACAKMLPGVHATSLSVAVLAGTALGLCHLILRPILRLLTFPIGCLTLGLSGFAIDCGMILLMSELFPGFRVDGIPYAALCALLLNGIKAVVSFA